MGFNIRGWFDAHPDARRAFKWFVVLFFGFVVTYLTTLVTNGIISVEHVPFIMAVVGFLGEKLKLLDPNVPWDFIGAGEKKKPLEEFDECDYDAVSEKIMQEIEEIKAKKTKRKTKNEAKRK